MHPVALACVLVLVINDWVLKPLWPGVVTGKLSDLAGLAFAPVLLSAVIGVALHALAKLGARIDPSLTERRLIACCVATAVGFTVVKLVPPVADVLARMIGHHAEFYPDWTDVLCIPVVLISYVIGIDELRRVPLGRPAGIHRRGVSARPALADVDRLGGEIGSLPDMIDRWDVVQIDRVLDPRRA